MNGTVYDNGAPIVTSDTTDLPNYVDAIYVGSTGIVRVIAAGGQQADFVGALTGSIIPIRTRRVKATGTTASALVGLW